jgi:hypothetical protein
MQPRIALISYSEHYSYYFLFQGLFGQLRKEWDSAVNTFDKYTHSGVAVAVSSFLLAHRRPLAGHVS